MKLEIIYVRFREHCVAIPTELMRCLALTGFSACSSYGLSCQMKSNSNKKLSKAMAMFLTASVIVGAGQTAYHLYHFNRDFAKTKAEAEKIDVSE